MTRIKQLVERLNEELEDAKHYAEEYLDSKVKGNASWSNRYQEMSQDELKHAGYIHDRAMEEIEELSKVYTPPEKMLEKWNKEHKQYVEKAAWIKQMLTL